MNKIKVFIIDDQIDFIKGILHLYRNDKELDFVGYETNTDSFCLNLNPSLFDVVLVDIKMPKTNGITLIKNLITRFPYLKAIAFSVYYDFDKLQDAVGAGAKGYILKNSTKNIVTKAIKEIHQGNTFFHLDHNTKKNQPEKADFL